MHSKDDRPSSDVTLLLRAASTGDTDAWNRVFPSVYAELRALAQAALRSERPDHTLQATSLVHEAFLKLVDQQRATYRDRQHFLAIASTAMRRLLVDHARGRRRLKRGGEGRRVEADPEQLVLIEPARDLGALDAALTKLEQHDARKAKLVELRFFLGLSIEDVAGQLDISIATAKRDWIIARGFLYQELTGDGAPNG
jgi:RNA polymerase sigma factor (TIGR02999 family)